MEYLELIRAEHPFLTTLFALVLGGMVGSFLNVCILRIPVGRSIVYPGSTCACGKAIPLWHNLPVLSWLLLRGKAACCGGRISVQYPIVEFLTAAVFAHSWYHLSPALAIVGWILFAFLLVGSWIDWDYLILPDSTTLGLVFVGVILSFLVPSIHGYASDIHWLVAATQSFGVSLLGILISSGVILWVALVGEYLLKREAVGFGDVKLLGGIGAMLGWQGGMFAIFSGALIGTVLIALLYPFWRWWHARHPGRQLVGSRVREEDYPEVNGENGDAVIKRMVPFGPLLSLGALVYHFLLRAEVDAYLAEIGQMIYPSF